MKKIILIACALFLLFINQPVSGGFRRYASNGEKIGISLKKNRRLVDPNAETIATIERLRSTCDSYIRSQVRFDQLLEKKSNIIAWVAALGVGAFSFYIMRRSNKLKKLKDLGCAGFIGVLTFFGVHYLAPSTIRFLNPSYRKQHKGLSQSRKQIVDRLCKLRDQEGPPGKLNLQLLQEFRGKLNPHAEVDNHYIEACRLLQLTSPAHSTICKQLFDAVECKA